MNYEDNHYAKKAEKKKITVIIITAIIVTFVFNGIMYAVISQSMQKKLDKDLLFLRQMAAIIIIEIMYRIKVIIGATLE